jgi:hypothetical protein
VACSAEERTEAFTTLDVDASGSPTYASSTSTGTTGTVAAGSEYLVAYCLSYRYSGATISLNSSSPSLTVDSNLTQSGFMEIATGTTTASATCNATFSYSTNEAGVAIIFAFVAPGGGGSTFIAPYPVVITGQSVKRAGYY